jgi:polysaccharide biosynthesis transport protein
LQLKVLIDIILKRWWVAVIVAVVAAAVAYVYSINQPKIYETAVTIQGKPAKPDEGLNNFIKTELQRLPTALKSTATAAEIDARGKFDLGPDAIIGKIKAQARPNESIMVITVEDTDPQRAARIANTAAEIIRDRNLAFVATTPDDSKVFFDPLSRAPVPDRPSLPRTNLNTGAAFALGLVLGLILIFALEFFDTSLRGEEEAERITGLNVLGTIPPWQPTAAMRKIAGPTARPLSGGKFEEVEDGG